MSSNNKGGGPIGLGKKGVNLITKNKYARALGDKTDDLINKTRTGVARTFNAFSKKLGGEVDEIKSPIDLIKTDSITQVMIVIIFLLFLMISIWCINKVGLNKKNCATIDETYSKFPLISSITSKNETFKHRLRDYYIKTAYNCCSSGQYKNDFVNLCALRNCIRQGARCLDFEIYSIDNKPVIAASSNKDYNVKETYNYILFSQAMETISNYAFSGGNCPNPKDPMILHFRVMTSSTKVHDEIANQLYDTLSDKLLGKKFSYENNGKNIGSYPLLKLREKVIVMVDKANPIFVSTLLNEYVNITSNSAFVRELRFSEVKFNHDTEELKFYNQQNMTIVLPDLSPNNKNYSYRLANIYGCQMIGLSFQKFDDYMKDYTQFFDNAGYAFILKPIELRYVPKFIDKPKCADERLSYAAKSFGLPGGLGEEEI
jgi:hypothetical protein